MNKQEQFQVQSDSQNLNQWMLLGSIISYISLMLLSFIYKFDTSAISVMFLSQIIMNRLFFLVKKRESLSTGINIFNLILLIAQIVNLV